MEALRAAPQWFQMDHGYRARIRPASADLGSELCELEPVFREDAEDTTGATKPGPDPASLPRAWWPAGLRRTAPREIRRQRPALSEQAPHGATPHGRALPERDTANRV